MKRSLYWHDYETFGVDPRRDRPSQFAGIRTDESLDPIGEPLELFCQPTPDYLPSPEACLLTGITPHLALKKGLPEVEFIARIEAQLGKPGTCGVGYNSIRFDDEVTRNSLYRSLRDPYSREWRNGCSRWDVIDLVRMAYALRPDGFNWPADESGLPVFKLERLTAENGIEHGRAHDALADVRATIELVRRLRSAQPRLYDWYYGLRFKNAVLPMLDPAAAKPLLHVSGMYARELGCIAPVLPIHRLADNPNEFVVFDLRADPDELLTLDADSIRSRLFKASVDLAPDEQRLPLKTVHANRSPALAPLSTLDGESAARWQIDLERVDHHAAALLARRRQLQSVLTAVYRRDEAAQPPDPDLAIYSGGFVSQRDRACLQEIIVSAPQDLVGRSWDFQDRRLDEMVFRYRARNFADTLTAAEKSRWREFCRQRLNDADGGFWTFDRFDAEIERLQEGGSADPAIIESLRRYRGELRDFVDRT